MTIRKVLLFLYLEEVTQIQRATAHIFVFIQISPFPVGYCSGLIWAESPASLPACASCGRPARPFRCYVGDCVHGLFIENQAWEGSPNIPR